MVHVRQPDVLVCLISARGMVLNIQEAGDVVKHPELLSLALQRANLEDLAAALKLPPAPAAKPEDPEGYFTGLLRDGTDPGWSPELYYDPAALDLANADCSHLEPLVAYPSLLEPNAHQASSPSYPDKPVSADGNAGQQRKAQHDTADSSIKHAAPDLQEHLNTPSSSVPESPAVGETVSQEASALVKSASGKAAAEETMAAKEAAVSSKQAKRSGDQSSMPASGAGKQTPAPATTSKPSTNEPAAATSRSWLSNVFTNFIGRSQPTAEAAPDAASQPVESKSASKHKKRRRKNRDKAAAADREVPNGGPGPAEVDAGPGEDVAVPGKPARPCLCLSTQYR